MTLSGGTSGIYWYCDGSSIRSITEDGMSTKLRPYKTTSMFFSGGFGFWVMNGDASDLKDGGTWCLLSFDHDDSDGYPSYLTTENASPTLRCHHEAQIWPGMLLPVVYLGPPTKYGEQGGGGLKGELPIFLALIDFALDPDHLQSHLPSMFHSGSWRAYNMADDRKNTQIGLS